jgi:hypothetical protein
VRISGGSPHIVAITAGKHLFELTANFININE